MAQAFGSTHFFGFAQAGAWNSVTSVGSFVYMPGLPSGLKQTKPLVFSKQARSMGERAGRYGQYMVEGTISTDFHYEGLTKLFANAFATSTSAGTNFNTHTFTIDETGDFENPYGLVIYDNKDLKTQRNLSCHVKDITLSFPSEPFCGFTATILGASRSRENAVSPSFGSLLPVNPFGDGSTTGLVVTTIVNGNTYAGMKCKQMTIKFTNPVDLLKSAGRQAAVQATRPQSKYQVEASWTWVYNSDDALSSDWLTAWDAETTGDLKIQLLSSTAIPSSSPSTNYSLTIDVDDLYIKGEDPIVTGPGEIEQTFTASGAIEAVSGTTPFTITLVNNEAAT